MYKQENSLPVRRLRLAQSLRACQTQRYRAQVRKQLLVGLQQGLTNENIVRQLLELNQQCRRAAYSLDSIRNAINYAYKNMSFGAEDSKLLIFLGKCHEVAVQKNDQDCINQMKQISLRILQGNIVLQNKQKTNNLPIDGYFRQLLTIICCEQKILFALWQQVSLIPTEAFFIPCLLTFLVHVEHLSKIEDTVVTIILKCLRNFTGESNSQCPRIDLTLAYNIIKKIAAIIEHYELEQTDLQCLAECLRSLLVNTQSSNIVGVIAESNIFYELRKYVRNEQPNTVLECGTVALIYFLGRVFADNSCCPKVLNDLGPTFFNELAKLLSRKSFTSHKSDRPKMTTATLYCVSNLSTISYALDNFFISGLFKAVLRKVNQPHCGVDVAIVLHNVLLLCRRQQVQVMCQQKLLAALQTLIKDSYNIETVMYTLGNILRLITRIQEEQSQTMPWFFNQTKILQELNDIGLLHEVEGFITSQNEVIASFAEKIIIKAQLRNQ